MRAAQSTIWGFGCAITIALAVGACRAKERGAAGSDTTGGAAATTGASGVENVANRPFNGDPRQAQRGRFLFVEYNCYGCHGGLAGGAMGPSLRDTIWKYGGTDQQVHASIHDGRPMGMPAWGTTLSDSQIGDIMAYIRSLRTTAEPKFFFINNQMADSLGLKRLTMTSPTSE
jgi:mono/diheme cytochrome c family protein